MINYARQHPHLALAAALIVLAGCSWLTVMLAVWWLHRPAAYPVQQYDQYDDGYYPAYPTSPLVLIDHLDEPKAWEDLDPEEQADQLIAEWQCVCAETSSRNCPIHQDTAVSALPEYTFNWQDDPDLIVWDAKQQADRCWQILYVEFPRLRAELGIAA